MKSITSLLSQVTLSVLFAILLVPARSFAEDLPLISSVEGKQYGECKSPDSPQYLVVVFASENCPIANSYLPALNSLRSEFGDSKFDFVIVHTNKLLTVAEAKKHQSEYELTWDVALDRDHAIAKALDAKVSPEAFVVDLKDSSIVYRGRIDDRFPDYGKKKPSPSREDLKIAMSEIAAGKSVSVPETKAVGCLIRTR